MKIFRTLFLSIFVVLGIAASSFSVWSSRYAYQSESWPQVLGRIVEASCQITTGKPSTSTRHVKYEYEVNSRKYVNDREHFGLRSSTRGCMAGYVADQPVTIFYKPDDPGDSVLVPGLNRYSLLGFIIGIVFAAFGLGGGYLYDRIERRKSAAE